MARNSLMHIRLLMLAICVLAQDCHCVPPPTDCSSCNKTSLEGRPEGQRRPSSPTVVVGISNSKPAEQISLEKLGVSSHEALASDGNEETSLSSVSSEVNSKKTSSNRGYSRNTVEPNDNSVAALPSSSLQPVEELSEEGIRRIDGQVIREGPESKKQEKEDESEKDQEMECQEAERWPQQQEGSLWRCEHCQRLCGVRFPCCGQFYPCHRCHNNASNCKNNEAKACDATHLKCSLCQHEQKIDESSAVCSGCGVKMADYFCSICKSFMGVHKNPYHCDLCGICRFEKDKMYHCEVCNVCVKKRLKNNHKCIPNSGHDECCICLEDVFRSCHIFLCGHKAHRKCALKLIRRGRTTCPMCRRPLRLHPFE